MASLKPTEVQVPDLEMAAKPGVVATSGALVVEGVVMGTSEALLAEGVVTATSEALSVEGVVMATLEVLLAEGAVTATSEALLVEAVVMATSEVAEAVVMATLEALAVVDGEDMEMSLPEGDEDVVSGAEDVAFQRKSPAALCTTHVSISRCFTEYMRRK